MNVRIVLPIAACATSALAACGGGGSTPTPARIPTTAPSTAPSASAAVTQTFDITIPTPSAAGSATGRTRKPLYVSPGTMSVRIVVQSVDGVTGAFAPTVAKTVGGAAGCAATPSGLRCAIVATAAAGNDVFAVSTYASPDGSGAPLATTTVAANVVAGTNPPIDLSLSGVASAVAFAPATLPLVNDGTIHRYAVTVDAVDSSGAAIVGGAPYASPISLAVLDDPTHALSISTASVSQPGTVVTVTFDGSKSLGNASIVAVSGGTTVATLGASPLDFAPSSLLVYDDQTGGQTETIAQAGFTGTFLASLANRNDGTVRIVPGPLGSGSAVASVVPTTTFDLTSLVVGNGSYAGSVPVAIVPHPGPYQAFAPQHALATPASLARSSDGTLYSADAATGSIVAFDPSRGTYASYVVDPNDAGPTSLAFDANGLLWFTDGNALGSFDTVTHAVRTFASGLFADANVSGIVRGPSGTMAFFDRETNDYPLHGGAPSAIGLIDVTSGAASEYHTPDNAGPCALTTGPDDAVWFADSSGGAIGRMTRAGSFASFAVNGPGSPNYAPQLVITGPDAKIWFVGSNIGLGSAYGGTIDPSTGAVALASTGFRSGNFTTLIVGSDHNLWYGEQISVGGFFFSPQEVLGVVNVTTHATYTYPAVVPEFVAIGALVDPGDRSLYVLDQGYGQIARMTFR